MPSTASLPPVPAAPATLALLRLTLPVPCERLPGVYDMGQEWIRQWGDGKLPPLAPTCVRAAYYGRMVFL